MNQERVFQVLVGPHVSEKAAIIAEQSNQYVFKVAVDATKPEIKKSVEQLFKVKVSAVRTLKVKGKVKRNRFGFSTNRYNCRCSNKNTFEFVFVFNYNLFFK